MKTCLNLRTNWICLRLLGGLVFSLMAAAAHAQPYTYYFTASPGQTTEFNGSTITVAPNPDPGDPFTSGAILTWSFSDSLRPILDSPGNSGLDYPPSGVDANMTGWDGAFGANAGAFDYYMTGSESGSGSLGDYDEQDPFVPSEGANGAWTPETAQPTAVPEPATFQLLGMAGAVFGVSQWSKRFGVRTI
jgi:hypothetical protein